MEDDDFNQKAGTIRQLAALPIDQMISHLAGIHPNIETIAPNITPHIHSTAVKAVQFLNSRLPNVGNELPLDKMKEPSIAVKNAWLNLHDLVSDPLKVLDHVENGSLNRHHVEVLQSVYPDLHQEISQRVLNEVGNLKVENKEMPYRKKLALSKLLGVPLDTTMTPASMQSIIASAAPNTGPQAQANQPTKASGPELSQINKVNSLTETKLQSREIQRRK